MTKTFSSAGKRILVADPSFRDWIGHHAPYDISIQNAARNLGFECDILANKAIVLEEMPGVDVIPVFSQDAWGRECTTSGKIDLRDIPLYLLGKLCLLLCDVWPKATRTWGYLPGSGMIATTGRSLCAKVIPLGKYLPYALRKAWNRLPATLAEAPMPHWVCWLRSLPVLPTYYELRAILRERKFSKGDMLFAHMITPQSFGMWALAANWISRKGAGEIVLLFRYPAQMINPNAENIQTACRLIERAFLRGKVRGATDSILLAQEYARFLAMPLEEYPIPHLPEPAPARSSDKAPFCCVSLGNSRAEKGMVEILDAIRLLERSGEGANFVFRLQANDPDNGSAPFVEQFAREEHPGTELLCNALPPQAYAKLLADADIVLVPYWSDVYGSRTSGVLFEAMAAGKPVITTAGTWMARETARYGKPSPLVESRNAASLAEAIRKTAATYSEEERNAQERALSCRVFHSAERLVDMLMRSTPPAPIEKGAELLMVYPMNNLTEAKSGSCTRVLNLYRLLNEHDYAVSFLAPHQHCTAGPDIALTTYDETQTAFSLLEEKRCAKLNPVEGWLLSMISRLRYARKFRLALTSALIGKRAVLAEYAFDVPHIAPFTRALRIPLIATAHDRHAMACNDSALRKKMDRYEIRALKQADFVGTVSPSENRYFAECGVPNMLTPNPGDPPPALIASTDEARDTLMRLGVPSDAPFFFFIGSVHGPNLEAKDRLKGLAKEVREQRLPFTIVVAGSCAAPEETEHNFIATGLLDIADREALYAACAAIVSPLPEGTGGSVKTVEAMARGKVIIGSKATFRGLNVQNGSHCFIEESVPGYIKSMRALLNDETLRAEIARNAIVFAERYDYRNVFAPYLDILRQWPEVKEITPFGAGNR